MGAIQLPRRPKGTPATLLEFEHGGATLIADDLRRRSAHVSPVEGVVLARPTVNKAARNIGAQARYLLTDLVDERPLVIWRGAREYLRRGPRRGARGHPRPRSRHADQRLRARVAHVRARLLSQGTPRNQANVREQADLFRGGLFWRVGLFLGAGLARARSRRGAG